MPSEFNKSENFINRELSWLDFDLRCLSEAKDSKNPFFERLKFLAITCSNLDEFFMVRVASLKNMEISDYNKKDASGLTPKEQLEKISEKTHKLVNDQYSVFSRVIVTGLKKCGISILKKDELNKNQTEFLYNYFKEEIYPVLTPMAVDSSRPFPLIHSNTLNICSFIKKEKSSFATVQVPSIFNRLIKLPSDKNKEEFILLEDVIIMFISELYTGYDVVCSYPYRVMRDADIPIDEDEGDDLLLEIEKNLKQRERSGVIRLEVKEDIDKELLKFLKTELNISKDDIYKIKGPIDLTVLNKIYSLDGYESLKYKHFKPQVVPRLRDCEDIFEEIKKGDILLYHPYDSFSSVVNLIKKSARDKEVLAIKQTLYRVSSSSPIIAALSEAAENGKQVTVLVELKARFDEENNIIWARKLENAGCHVIYGLLGLKTHSKITEIVRREEDGIRRYVHLGTGNYNDITANFYTDIGILTCSPSIGADAGAFFNMLSGFSEPPNWNKLILAPLWLRKRMEEMIEREIYYAKKGKSARIIAKMNSLLDPSIIALLYKASAAGVKIDLIVRGICALKAGVKGLSENITVKSIIGRYLEHTRIYYFYNDGRENIFCSSADLMQRNLNRRVEIMFPIEDEALKESLKNILDVQIKDNMRSHIQINGVYKKQDRRGKVNIDCQEISMEEALRNSKKSSENKFERIFIPKTKPDEL